MCWSLEYQFVRTEREIEGTFRSIFKKEESALTKGKREEKEAKLLICIGREFFEQSLRQNRGRVKNTLSLARRGRGGISGGRGNLS